MAYRTYSTANGWIVDKNGKGDFVGIGTAITAFNAAVTAGTLTTTMYSYTRLLIQKTFPFHQVLIWWDLWEIAQHRM